MATIVIDNWKMRAAFTNSLSPAPERHCLYRFIINKVPELLRPALNVLMAEPNTTAAIKPVYYGRNHIAYQFGKYRGGIG